MTLPLLPKALSELLKNAQNFKKRPLGAKWVCYNILDTLKLVSKFY